MIYNSILGILKILQIPNANIVLWYIIKDIIVDVHMNGQEIWNRINLLYIRVIIKNMNSGIRYHGFQIWYKSLYFFVLYFFWEQAIVINLPRARRRYQIHQIWPAQNIRSTLGNGERDGAREGARAGELAHVCDDDACKFPWTFIFIYILFIIGTYVWSEIGGFPTKLLPTECKERVRHTPLHRCMQHAYKHIRICSYVYQHR